MSGVAVRSARLMALLLAVAVAACQRSAPSYPPAHYLLVTHPALNRLTIYDLSLKKIVGALPTQKLPHDMLVTKEGLLYVVNSGSQCITTYDLRSPQFWTYARDFVKGDSANLYAPRTPSANMMGSHPSGEGKDTAAWTTLNRDPVQSLPASFAHTYLTDLHFPDIAKPMHEKVNAFAHRACYDCHDRSVGTKPFGPAFSSDSSTIHLVQLKGRDVVFLNTKTLAIERRLPLPIPERYSPIETWITPDQSTAFVTCRNEIGQSERGLILVVDLRAGTLLKTITAGIYPWHLLPNPEGTKLYVNNFQSSRISIVDVAKREIVDSLIAENGPAMMLLRPAQHQILVSCFYTDRILVIDLMTKKVVQSIDVDSNPTSLEFSRDGKRLYVLCGGESSLDVVDVAAGRVLEKEKMLFGAYAFHRIDEEASND